MKKFSKLICFILVLASVLTANNTKCLAATVGEQLLTPDSGWVRYDDSNSLIKITNFDYPRNTSTGAYKGTLSHSDNVNSKVSFVFYGTKIRIIGEPTMEQYRTIAKITIDGQSYTYSEISKTGNNIKQGLEFEKTDLKQDIHYVTIEKSTPVTKTLTFDAVDIDGTLLDYTNPIYLKATSDKTKVDLTWTSVPGATSYTVKRSTTSGGSYQDIATVTDLAYTDTNVKSDTTYFYVVTAMVNGKETANSNEVEVTIAKDTTPSPIEGNKAILEVVMTNGTIKEYDLTAEELEKFLTWYDNRSDGLGKSYFKMPKKSNVKPFISRNEYLSYDKIYSFEIKDYNE